MKAAAPNPAAGTIAQRRQQKNKHHVGFADETVSIQEDPTQTAHPGSPEFYDTSSQAASPLATPVYISHDRPGPIVPLSGMHLMVPGVQSANNKTAERPLATHADSWRVEPRGEGPKTPGLHNFNSPSYLTEESPSTDYLRNEHDLEAPSSGMTAPGSLVTQPATTATTGKSTESGTFTSLAYTHHLRTQPPKTFRQTLKPWNGRLRHDNWAKVAIRPFILFAYPSVLWSTLVYSLSIGWLIVLSETVSAIYRAPAYTYNFSPLGAGLVYISPFIGGILGTAVAGKLSDVVVQFMSRKNGGIYEPEFRLVMALPVAITTCIGLMGFGWSAGEHDKWIVPTVFFGIISFGCSLGSTTAITFAVDSYRQYAGEALVTMNFSKSEYFALIFEKKKKKPVMKTDSLQRYLSRPRLFPLLPELARSGRVEVCVHSHRVHSARLPCYHNTNVHLWKEGADVDCTKEHDGEVLKCFACAKAFWTGRGLGGGLKTAYNTQGWPTVIRSKLA